MPTLMLIQKLPHVLFLCAYLVCFCFVELSVASDGPQNTGRLNLKLVDNSHLEAILQVDKKVLLNPDELFSLVSIENKKQRCQMDKPKMLSDETTLSATTTFDCFSKVRVLTIGLIGIENVPQGFSMGIKTPLDHFSLTRDESKKMTQLSPAHLFFWAAFSLGVKKNNLLGKPYALFFGGLDTFPWGVWWLCLLTAIGVSGLRKQNKVFAVLLAGLISFGVSYYVLAQEASLRIVEAPRLNLIYLSFVLLVSALGFFEKRSWVTSLSLLVLLALSLASGIELSIVLRWLEGNSQVPLNEAVSGFYLGLLTISTLLIWPLIGFSYLRQFENKLVAVGRFGVIAFTCYAGISLGLRLL